MLHSSAVGTPRSNYMVMLSSIQPCKRIERHGGYAPLKQNTVLVVKLMEHKPAVKGYLHGGLGTYHGVSDMVFPISLHVLNMRLSMPM
jgi:hypothetical protein